MRKQHADRIRVALAFPNSYFLGMSNLGFQSAYRLFNDHDVVVCERVFAPDSRRQGRELSQQLVTLESQTLVRDFDVLAFSVSFELDYVNVVSLLEAAGLPLRASERSPRHPLVVAGGAASLLNPEPLAPFVDVFACGDGEELIPRLVAALAAAGSRQALLADLARSDGFYVPSLYDVESTEDGMAAPHVPRPGTGARMPVRKATSKKIPEIDPPATSIFTPDTEFGARFLVEVVRGCPNLCRFCWAGYNYLPVRRFAAGRILSLARAARRHTRRAGLVSIALCHHPELEEIVSGLHEMGYTISPASLRMQDLSRTLLRALEKGGERTVTIAPEAGTDRLRHVINKKVTNAEILESAEMVFAEGIENLKLYFMVGLPTETDEDLVAIADLTAAIRERMLRRARSRGRAGRISVSVNPLVPKPNTPFQWVAMERPDVIAARLRRLKSLLGGMDNVSFTMKSGRHSPYQALLSLGDRRIAPMLEAAARCGGDLRRAASETGVDVDSYVFRQRSIHAALPWDVVSGHVRTTFLRREWERATGAGAPDSGRPDAGAAGPG